MKYLKLILLTLISLSAVPSLALPPVESMPVQRFTDLGGTIRWEVGTLFFHEGFISTNLNEYPAEVQFALFTPEVLAAISEKFVTPLSSYTRLSKSQLKNFTRSIETYSIKNVAYVIVSLNGAKPTKPIVSIVAMEAGAVEEGQNIGEFMITLSAPASKDITVKFKFTGNARKGKDYQSFPAKLVIPEGNVSGGIEVLPVDDTKLEKTETVILNLKSGKGYKVGPTKKAIIQIFDND